MKKKNLVFISSAAIACALGFGLQVRAYEPDAGKPAETLKMNESSSKKRDNLCFLGT